MMARLIVGLAMVSAVGITNGADLSSHTDFATLEKRDLFKFCSPEEQMTVFVSSLPEYAIPAGLTSDNIRNATENRLRNAQIYAEDAYPILRISILLGEPDEGGRYFPFYSITLEYYRILLADFLDEYSHAATWTTRGAGQGDANTILGTFHRLLDRFVASYLRVRDSEECRTFRQTLRFAFPRRQSG